jgi:hypothetical protein
MTLQTRLSKLEASASLENNRRWHCVFGHPEECEAQRRALIDTGQAQESENFVFVSPMVATSQPEQAT